MRRILLMMCMIWLLSPVIHASYDDASGVFYLPNKDGKEEYTVNGGVTFRTDNTIAYTYRDTGVVFYPKKEGDMIIATIESLNLPSGAALLIYDNNIEAIKDKIGKSGNGGTYSYFPAGYTAAITSTTTEYSTTYTSQDAGGAMAFGMHSSSWTKEANGFVIKITSGVPKDMEYVSSEFQPSSALSRGARNAVLGIFDITMDGIDNPLKLTGLSANVSGLENAGVTGISLLSLADASVNPMAISTNGSLSYSGEVTLRSGDNYFCITGNLPADFVGSLPVPTEVTATVGGEQKTITTQGTITVENSILMPSQNIIYTITDAAKFYDDGGKDSSISLNFNGSVTFVPATPGQKIRIDFDKLAIFYNSSAVSVGNQDVFKFYNGRTADEANLITTLTDTKKIVKSTADDGSITVTLASKTGVPAEGWEAVVSQFLPGDMTVSGAEPVETATEEASACDTNILSGMFNIRANNILNPISITFVNLKLTGTKNLEALNVYYIGEEISSTSIKKVGTATPASDGNLIVAFEDAQLAEGSNYFAIFTDIKSSALNGEKFSITPISAAYAGGSVNFTATEQKDITISNLFKHHVGTDLRNIHDTWRFESTFDPVSTTKHLLSTQDCIVTFVPDNGYMAELEHQYFNLYYSNSTYSGARAKYEVYSGREVNADNLLWKLDSYDGKPEGKLRSTAADGSLTIVFNANTTNSYYARDGWKATVTPFKDHNMTVKSVTVSQPNTSVIMPGAENEEILSLEVETEGTLDSRKLTGITIDLKNSLPSVNKVSIMTTNAAGEKVAVGSADTAQSTQLTVPCNFNLTEGKNSFTITYNIKSDVEPEAVIDGKIISVTTDQSTENVENGDPAGERIAKYIYLMSEGDHVVTIGKSIHFYDDGGADGILNKNGLKGTVTFVPEDPTKVIRVTVVSYNTAATAILDFYSGREVNANNSLGQCKQRTFPELPMVSKAEDGAMFVNVACQSYSYSNYDGWDMIVEQYTPSALHATSAELTNNADEQTVRGATDAAMGELKVAIDGDNQSLGVKKVTGKITASNIGDVKDVKLYYTAKFDGFNPSKLVASTTPNSDGSFTLEISEPELANELGNYYYWFTTSLAPEATVGNSVKLEVNNITFTDDAMLAATGVSAETTVKAGFAGGEYVIGNSTEADYDTFAAAIEAMGNAIEGPVKFLVESGTYSQDVEIKNVKGTSQTNTITITSKTGKAEDVILEGKGYVDGGYGSKKYGIVNIENTDWVTIDALTINARDNNSSSYPYYVNYVEASRHNTLSNCVMTAPTANSYSGLDIVYATCSDPVENGKNPDYLTIKHNSFTGGYIAIYIQGSNGYIKNEPMKSLTVCDNQFTDIGSKAVYPYQIEDVTISGNTIIAGEAVSKSSYYAIDMVRCTGATDVCNNRIINNQTVYSSGIYLRDNTHGTETRPIRVFNNSVAITASPNSSTAGVNISTECSNVDLVHNSINIEGTGGYGVYLSNNKANMKGIRIMNNAIRVNVESEYSYAFHMAESMLYKLKESQIATNAMHSGTNKIASFATDLDEWKTITGDSTLIHEEPKYLSITDLHLSEEGSLIAGTPVDYVTKDFEGNKRVAIPTIGAYEFVKISQDPPLISEGYPKVDNITHNSARVATRWDMSGKLYVKTLKSDEEAPTVDELLAGESVDVIDNTDIYTALTDLEEQTAYTTYAILTGFNDKNSEIASVEYTTVRYIAPLTVTMDAMQPDADADTEVTITPAIEGGDTPYTYIWTNQSGKVMGDDEDETIDENGALKFYPTLPGIFTLSVKSADGQEASAHTAIKVYGTEQNADFTDNLLNPESYWWGDKDNANTYFFSGSFAFPNYCNAQYHAWEGFAYANLTDNTFATLFTDQFKNAAGGGSNDSPAYAMFFAYGTGKNIEILKSREGAKLDYVYVNNSAYAVNSILNGDAFAEPFSDGDYHKIVFTGDDPTGTPVECFLADYTDGKTELVTEWKKVDLTPLGDNVKNLTVKIESSNNYVPAYAALDNLSYAEDLSGVDSREIADFTASEVKTLRVTTMDGIQVITVNNPDRLLRANNTDALQPGIYIVEYLLIDGRRVVIKRTVK